MASAVALILLLVLAPAAALLPARLARAETLASSGHRGASPVGPEPVAERHHGGLYRISGRGRVAYLFGTVHVGAPSFYPMAPEVERALAGADQVVVELDTGAKGAFLHALDRHARYAGRRHRPPPGAGDDGAPAHGLAHGRHQRRQHVPPETPGWWPIS
ncbi:TraB/GumN family protein [Massilia sp. Se16.2.3]|uniref:TraB/GumN family protein n=1 Tax=Massilia sp. Se16.2.3 TaxID=2709303 RepID=UPI001600A6C1|nr:TraB/GumN family protein [Massilia sp. Se16.2.3]QNA99193.1 TraB/GumN family protein [Massilia sp. Se16.2.3]